MEPRSASFLNLLVCVGLVGQLSPFGAQSAASAATNHVLELDGTGGYVELPPNIFNDLTEATVEAWARWDDFRTSFQRVFNYGDALRDLSITKSDDNTLLFVEDDAKQTLTEWRFQSAAMGTSRRGIRSARNGADGAVSQWRRLGLTIMLEALRD